jgi:peroxiredoxin Q/BCP
MPVAGDPAPDFALADETGAVHRLSDQRGWTVVYFYPKDDTPGCTTEACAFRDANDELEAAGAAVWGISPDDAASHGRFRAKFQLTFPLLSDEDHATAEAYGAWVEKTKYGRTYMGIQRSTFLIDSQGVVRRVWKNVEVDGHDQQVLDALGEL